MHDEDPQDPQEKWTASRVVELELEARDQERIAITRLVEQANHLVLEVIRGSQGRDALIEASSQLGKAIDILKWPLQNSD
ncbi:hypothetical protein D3C84_1223750 [compost metagenome]